MLVDDNSKFLKVTSNFLESNEELRVIACFNSGMEAITKAQEVNPDIVLIDLVMPEMSGIEVIHQLRTILPEVGIIALSMHSADAYRTAALKAGADLFVAKTHVVLELLPAIQYLINKPSKEDLNVVPSKCILVVEDDPDLRRIYSKALLKKGYDVDLAATISEASALLQHKHYAVFICDIHIGEERGTQVLAEQKHRLEALGTQIVMASAHGEYRYQTEALGADFFLEKPFNLESLLTLIDRLIKKPKTASITPKYDDLSTEKKADLKESTKRAIKNLKSDTK